MATKWGLLLWIWMYTEQQLQWPSGNTYKCAFFISARPDLMEFPPRRIVASILYRSHPGIVIVVVPMYATQRLVISNSFVEPVCLAAAASYLPSECRARHSTCPSSYVFPFFGYSLGGCCAWILAIPFVAVEKINIICDAHFKWHGKWGEGRVPSKDMLWLSNFTAAATVTVDDYGKGSGSIADGPNGFVFLWLCIFSRRTASGAYLMTWPAGVV